MPPPAGQSPHALRAAAIFAAAASTLLAFDVPPSFTQLNQCMAFIGWGIFVALLGASKTSMLWRADRGLVTLLASLGLIVAASAVSPLWAHVPTGVACNVIGTVVVASAMAATGAVMSASNRLQAVFGAMAWAWLVAGVLSFFVGAVQIFAPDFADGNWIARTAFVGRAAGNLRQPNHLSSLLLWSAIAVVWLLESGALKWRVAALFYALMMAGVVMSASRTGLVGVALMLLWGLVDKRLSRATRIMLMVSPVIYIAVWLGLASWAHHTQSAFGAETRLTGDGALASTRFAVWSNTLELIRQHPWVGVGVGGFNFAWSLTPFSNRSNEFFDHTHNLILQFVVELGLPVGLLVITLMSHALWRAFRASRHAAGLDGIALRCAFMVVLMMALHSQLEYPLWYAYFLLPTALALGLCLGRAPAADASVPTRPGTSIAQGLTLAGLLIAVSGVLVLYDYERVVALFLPSGNGAPLAERIADGKHSRLFSHYADYFEVNITDRPLDQTAEFKGATHFVLDARLMISWAKAYAKHGDLNRARNIAARLHEFHDEKSDAFFAECDQHNNDPATVKPFQCEPPTTALGYRDFE